LQQCSLARPTVTSEKVSFFFLSFSTGIKYTLWPIQKFSRYIQYSSSGYSMRELALLISWLFQGREGTGETRRDMATGCGTATRISHMFFTVPD